MNEHIRKYKQRQDEKTKDYKVTMKIKDFEKLTEIKNKYNLSNAKAFELMLKLLIHWDKQESK